HRRSNSCGGGGCNVHYRYCFTASEALAGSSEMVMVISMALSAANFAHQAPNSSPAALSVPMVLYRLSINTWVISKLPACRPLRKHLSISGELMAYSLESTRRTL